MSSKTTSKLAVCESLIREHRQMEALLEQLGQTLSGLNPDTPHVVETARHVMQRIEPEMNTHFACEEEALFPGVSPYHSMVLMEVEHEELIALRHDFLALFGKTDITAENTIQMRETGTRFINEMLDHIGREDFGIFPTCEQALSDAEKEVIMEKMERIRAEAAAAPTPAISRAERKFVVLEADLTSPTHRPVFSKRLLDDSGLEIKHLIVQAGQTLPSHWSPKQITLICLKGTGIFTANEQQTDLKPGISIVMSPQLLHGIQAHSDCHLLLLLCQDSPK